MLASRFEGVQIKFDKLLEIENTIWYDLVNNDLSNEVEEI